MDTYGWNIVDGGLTEDESAYVSLSGEVVGATIAANASGGTGSYTYQWLGPEGFTASTATVEVEVNGLYTVTVTDQAGCSASESFNILSVGVEELRPMEFAVFPNPASELLFVDVPGDHLIRAEVVDMSGRVHESVVLASRGEGIQVGHLAAGVYIIQIRDIHGILQGRATVVVEQGR